MTDSYDYIVLGGGISGLSAAYYLQQKGFSTLLIEKTENPGGLVQSTTLKGFSLELGPNTVQMKSDELKGLINKLGLDSMIQYPSDQAKKRYILKNGSLTTLPASPLALLFGRDLLSFSDKLSIFRELFKSPHPKDATPSVDSFFRNRTCDTIADYFVNPFIAGIYAGDSKKLSMRHSFPQLWDMEQTYGSLIKGMKKSGGTPKPIFKLKGGLNQLCLKLAEKSSIVTEEVRKINRTEGYEVVTSQGQHYRSKNIINTLPVYAWKQLEWSGISTPPTHCRYAGIRVYHFSVQIKPEDWPHPGFGLLVPEKEQQLFLGCLFNSSIFSEVSPKDQFLLTVFVGGDRQPELVQPSAADFDQQLVANLQKVLGFEAAMELLHCQTYEQAIPQYDLNQYPDFVENLKEFEEKHPGFFFLGNYKNGIAVGDCVKNAHELAERLGG